jgi:hypothetical protein
MVGEGASVPYRIGSAREMRLLGITNTQDARCRHRANARNSGRTRRERSVIAHDTELAPMPHLPAPLTHDSTRAARPPAHRPHAGVQTEVIPDEVPAVPSVRRVALAHAADLRSRAQLALGLQRPHGNAYVQRTIVDLRQRADTPAAAAVQRDDEEEQLPTPQLGPVNLGLLPGDAPGGRIGFGAPLGPLLPEADTDPRDGGRPGPFDPRQPGDPRGGAPEEDAGEAPSWGVGLQGRYGEEEQAVGLGFGFTF